MKNVPVADPSKKSRHYWLLIPLAIAILFIGLFAGILIGKNLGKNSKKEEKETTDTTPRYSATGQLLVTDSRIVANSEEDSTSSNKDVLGADIAASRDLAKTVVKLLQGDTFYKKLAEKGNFTYSYKELKKATKVQDVKDTLFIEITVTLEDPEEAKQIANEMLAFTKPFFAEIIEYPIVTIVSYADSAVQSH